MAQCLVKYRDNFAFTFSYLLRGYDRNFHFMSFKVGNFYL